MRHTAVVRTGDPDSPYYIYVNIEVKFPEGTEYETAGLLTEGASALIDMLKRHERECICED